MLGILPSSVERSGSFVKGSAFCSDLVFEDLKLAFQGASITSLDIQFVTECYSQTSVVLVQGRMQKLTSDLLDLSVRKAWVKTRPQGFDPRHHIIFFRLVLSPQGKKLLQECMIFIRGLGLFSMLPRIFAIMFVGGPRVRVTALRVGEVRIVVAVQGVIPGKAGPALQFR